MSHSAQAVSVARTSMALTVERLADDSVGTFLIAQMHETLTFWHKVLTVEIIPRSRNAVQNDEENFVMFISRSVA
jgi:hypothetical protein